MKMHLTCFSKLLVHIILKVYLFIVLCADYADRDT